MEKFVAVILAAGEGTRMKSKIPKVLHQICGRPMLDYVIDACSSLKISKIIVVAGKNSKDLKAYLPKNTLLARQIKPKGTADAVLSARKFINTENLVVVYGDTPLLSGSTISELMKKHAGSGASATLLTFEIDNPKGYGRIIRDRNDKIISIKEDKDLTPKAGRIKEVNAGLSCFKVKDLFNVVKYIRPNNKKREYYLTDAIEILSKRGKKIASLTTNNRFEAEGINSQEQLVEIEKIMRQKIIKSLMKKGVRFIDPSNTYIADKVKIGQDTVIYPGTYIEKDCSIGKRCKVGPYAHIRSHTTICNNVKIGNFVEINRSFIDKNTVVSHFSYIGDGRIGKNVNIGAGTVTANYDGKKKNETLIGDGAFIGSGTMLVAPVKIGRNAITGAGSVVTKNKNVKPNTIVVGVPARVLKIKRG